MYYIYIYACSRCFYPKRLHSVHSGYTFFLVNKCSLGIESTTFAVLTQCFTTEPQEHNVCNVNSQWRPQQKLNWQIIIFGRKCDCFSRSLEPCSSTVF